MRYIWALLAMILVSGAGAAASQAAAEPDSISLKKGNLVRVTIAGSTTVCIIEEIQPGVLSLESWETTALQRVRIADISSLEIQAPRSPARGAVRGALIGGGIGLLGGFMAGMVSGDDDPGSFMAITAEEKASILVMTLTIPCAIIGGFVGAAYPGKDWKKIPLDARLGAGVSPNGTIGVGITVPIGGS